MPYRSKLPIWRNVPEILARAQEIIRKSGGTQRYTDHAELLYDEHGLPK